MFLDLYILHQSQTLHDIWSFKPDHEQIIDWILVQMYSWYWATVLNLPYAENSLLLVQVITEMIPALCIHFNIAKFLDKLTSW